MEVRIWSVWSLGRAGVGAVSSFGLEKVLGLGIGLLPAAAGTAQRPPTTWAPGVPAAATRTAEGGAGSGRKARAGERMTKHVCSLVPTPNNARCQVRLRSGSLCFFPQTIGLPPRHM